MKITVFTMNMKYSVKLEMGQMEQTYKINESDDIKGFCFAMIIGVISGVYSTLFIATPIVVDMRSWLSKKEEKSAE